MLNEEGSSAAVERVWGQMRSDPRSSLEHRLPPSDLQTLLLSVARARAAAVTPARVMRRWREDSFVQPAVGDPRALSLVEARLWELLPEHFAGVELSPVAPLGTCSAVARVDQNRVITTCRGSEVVSDPTNVLALEAAARRRRTRSERVDLAATHRVVRAQRFAGPGLFQHFRLFALLSSGRDRGSGLVEAAMLTDHLRFWTAALARLVPGRRVVMEFSAFDSPVLVERFRDTVLPALEPLPEAVTIEEHPDRQRARGYYNLGALRAAVGDGPEPLEVGDGGFTDWTAQLTADAKERCLISCVSTERLVQLAASG
jgi:hypothetical protein